MLSVEWIVSHPVVTEGLRTSLRLSSGGFAAFGCMRSESRLLRCTDVGLLSDTAVADRGWGSRRTHIELKSVVALRIVEWKVGSHDGFTEAAVRQWWWWW